MAVKKSALDDLMSFVQNTASNIGRVMNIPSQIGQNINKSYQTSAFNPVNQVKMVAQTPFAQGTMDAAKNSWNNLNMAGNIIGKTAALPFVMPQMQKIQDQQTQQTSLYLNKAHNAKTPKERNQWIQAATNLNQDNSVGDFYKNTYNYTPQQIIESAIGTGSLILGGPKLLSNPLSLVTNSLMGAGFNTVINAAGNIKEGRPIGQNTWEAAKSGSEFGTTLALFNNATDELLGPLFSKIAPKALGNINKYINLYRNAPTKAAADKVKSIFIDTLKRNVAVDVLKGFAGMGTFGATIPTQTWEAKIKNIVDQGLTGAAFNVGSRAVGMGANAAWEQAIKPTIAAGPQNRPGYIRIKGQDNVSAWKNAFNQKMIDEKAYIDSPEYQQVKDLGTPGQKQMLQDKVKLIKEYFKNPEVFIKKYNVLPPELGGAPAAPTTPPPPTTPIPTFKAGDMFTAGGRTFKVDKPYGDGSVIATEITNGKPDIIAATWRPESLKSVTPVTSVVTPPPPLNQGVNQTIPQGVEGETPRTFYETLKKNPTKLYSETGLPAGNTFDLGNGIKVEMTARQHLPNGTVLENNSPNAREWYLERIASVNQGKGNASKALDNLLKQADEYGITLKVEPKPYGKIKGLTTEQLQIWYKSRGFVPDEGIYWKRDPQPVPLNPVVSISPVAKAAYDSTVKNDGVTIDQTGGQPTDGFSYSPYPERGVIVPKEKFSVSDTNSFELKNKDLLDQPGHFLGTWKDGDQIYLDVVKVGPPTAETLKNAMDSKQLAVFDLASIRGGWDGTLTIGKFDNKVYNPIDEATNILNQYSRKTSGAGSPGSVGGVPEVPNSGTTVNPTTPIGGENNAGGGGLGTELSPGGKPTAGTPSGPTTPESVIPQPGTSIVPTETALKTQSPTALESTVPTLPQTTPTVTTKGGQSAPPPAQPQLPTVEKPGVSSYDKIISQVKAKANKLYTESMDRFHPLSVIGKRAGEDVAMRRALTGHYGAGSTATWHTDFELSPILKESNVGDLTTATVALRDIELSKRGVQGSNTIDDILINGKLPGGKETKQTAEAVARLGKLREKLGAEGMTKLGGTLKKLYAYQDNLVKEYLVKTDIMSEVQYNAMKEKNQFYVPFKRVMEIVDNYLGVPSKAPGSVNQNVIFKILGSERQIKDPIESIIENTYKIVGLGKRQEVAKTLVSLKPKLPEGMITKTSGSGPDTISVYENGKKSFYKVPMEVAEAAKGMNQDQMSTIVNILAAPTRIFRATATGLNPEFALPNVVRDVQSAFMNVGLNPLKWVSGLAHMMKKDEVYQQFLKSGGMTSRVSLDQPYLAKTARELAGIKQNGIRITDPRRLFVLLEKIGQYSEQPTRIASFEKVLKETGSTADAAYAAQEATVNFARRGSKTQSINAIYAFLNARAQGTDRLLRTFKDDPIGASARLGMITLAPSIALYMWNRNFTSFKDPRIVPDQVKKNDFVLMLSDTPIEWLGGAQYAHFPKGDVGKLANPLETFMTYVDGGGAAGDFNDKAGVIRQAYLDAVGAFSPISNVGDLIPTALKPGIQDQANYDFFYKTPIVPESKLNYPAAFQTSKNTPAIYKEIGARLNVSPNRVENIFRGYLTGWARIGEMVTQPFSKQNTYSGQDINQTPIIRRFMGGAVRTEEEQQLNDMFKQKGILNKVQDIKTGVRYGNIPIENGIQEINKLLNEAVPTTPASNPSYLGPKEVSAADKTLSPTASAMQKQMEITKVQMQVQATGLPQEYGNKVYLMNPSTGGVESFSTDTQIDQKNLSPEAQKTLVRSNEFKLVRKLQDSFDGTGVGGDYLDGAMKKYNIDAATLEYDDKTLLPDDVQLTQINSEISGLSGDDLLAKLVSMRVVSEGSRKALLTNGIIDDLKKAGTINANTAAYLKSVTWDSKEKTWKISGAGSSIPKSFWKINVTPPTIKKTVSPRLASIKAPKISLNLKKTSSPKPSGIKMKAPAPLKISLNLRTPVKTLKQLGGRK